MNNSIEDKAYEYSKDHRKINPIMLMRKFKLNEHEAKRICLKVWRRQHDEARVLYKEVLENL